MNELTILNSNLPCKPFDLQKFLLFNEEKLQSVKAEIRFLQKAEEATAVLEQKKQEASNISILVLAAETRLGEIIKDMDTKKGCRNDIIIPKKPKLTDEPKFITPKSTKIKDIGISRNQAQRYEKLAKNKDIVEEVITDAKKNTKIATRAEVFNIAEERMRKVEKQCEDLDSGYKIFKEVSNALLTLRLLNAESIEKLCLHINKNTFHNFNTKILEVEEKITQLKLAVLKNKNKGE